MLLPPPPSILCEDLMIQILSWLPVKSLVRFKCVSKSLKSLISDPSFVKLHLQRSPKKVNLLSKLKDPLEDRSILSCSMLENPSSVIVEGLDHGCQFSSKHDYDIVGSCNGLVCLVDESSNDSYEEYQFCLWNPATRLRSENLSCRLVYFYFQGCCYHSVFSFGYDCLSNTYKVVAIFYKYCFEVVSLESELKVYDEVDNCWKNIQNFPGIPYSSGVYLNGTISWLAKPSSEYYVDFNELFAVSLDLGKETYKKLLLPRDFDKDIDAVPSLGVLKDCLCFYQYHKRTHFVIWQMKEYGVENSWAQVLSIKLPYYPLTVGMFENDGVLVMKTCDGSRVILYSQRDGKVECIKISNNIVWIYAMDYVQSLVSPCWT